MSGDASARECDASPETSELPVAEFERLGEALDAGIEEALRKIESGRVYNAENEKVRQGWLRVLARLVGERRKVAEARTLEDLSERVEELEAQRGTDLLTETN